MRRLFAVLLSAAMIFGFLPFGTKPAKALNMPYVPTSFYMGSEYYTRLREVVLTGDQRTDIVNVAVSQMGYHEGDSLEQLDGSALEGSADYTEYGYWWGTEVLGEPEGHYGAWCAIFVSWCARQAQVPVTILKNSSGANCSPARFDLTYYSGSVYTPQVGDLFFKSDWSHVGLVRSVDGDKFTTIEGNCTKMVKSRTLNIADYRFGVPEYNTSTLSYSIGFDANGGEGSVPDYSVLYDGDFTLPGSESFSRAGYVLAGWSVRRASDDKWFAEGMGWETEDAIALNGYAKSVFPAGSAWILDGSWREGGEVNDALVFHAVWRSDALLPGDVDCSGSVDMSDVSMLFGALSGDVELFPRGCENADANGDGAVNVMDITAVFGIIAES